MESDKRPHFPCEFCEDELSLIQSLTRGNSRGCPCENADNNRNRCNNCDDRRERCERDGCCDSDCRHDRDERYGRGFRGAVPYESASTSVSAEVGTYTNTGAREMCVCEQEREKHSHGNGMGCRMPEFGNDVALAIVYSPDHEFDDMYDVEKGLMEGTLFRRLDKPFGGASVTGKMGGCRG